jgi:hypothetical protein
MWLGREGLKRLESEGLGGGVEKRGLLGSVAFMPGSASQLERGEMEFKILVGNFSLV